MATTIAMIDDFITPEGGVPTAALIARAAAVPLPPERLSAIGVGLTSDVTALVAGKVRRRVTTFLVPSVPATAVPVLEGGDLTGAPIISVTVTAPGANYILPPIVRFPTPAGGTPTRKAQARAFLKVVSATVTAGGAGYSATPHVAFVGGLPPRGYFDKARSFPVDEDETDREQIIVDPGKTFCVSKINLGRKNVGGSGGSGRFGGIGPGGIPVPTGGRGYSPTTFVEIRGGRQNGSDGGARAVPVINPVNGSITAIIVTDMGSGYATFPKVNIIDPTGSGKHARAFAQLAVGTPATAHATVVLGVITAIIIDTAGSGYIGVPQIVITDPTGVGAAAIASMGVERVDMLEGGKGYNPALPPTVSLIPFFKFTWPDTANQAQPFHDLLLNALRRDVPSPVIEAITVS